MIELRAVVVATEQEMVLNHEKTCLWTSLTIYKLKPASTAADMNKNLDILVLTCRGLILSKK